MAELLKIGAGAGGAGDGTGTLSGYAVKLGGTEIGIFERADEPWRRGREVRT